MTNKLSCMRLTKSVEDYLKAIFKIVNETKNAKVGTNQLAEYLNITPASASNMLRKLKANKLVTYQKYGKLNLTKKGEVIAVRLLRKHRLWETFLYEQMNFSWDEVHEVAHQLEHIESSKLISELDKFLNYPTHDPHGDVIPKEDGRYTKTYKITLSEVKESQACTLVSVKDNSAKFLKYVTQIGLALSSEIKILEIRDFDHSMLISFDNKTENVSRKFAENVFVELI